MVAGRMIVSGLAALVASLAFAPAAHAVPLELAHQGRLFEASGAPVEGLRTLTFAIYSGANGGEPIWTEEIPTLISDGYYTVRLGDDGENPLSASVLDGTLRYLSLRVDGGGELEPRQPLVSVPYAIRAGEAESVPWSGVQDRPTSVDAFAALDCPNGASPEWSDGSWRCGPAPTARNCPGGQFVTGINADGSVNCAAPSTDTVRNFVNENCYVYFAWRDNCEGCTSGDRKWGRVNANHCTVGEGEDSVCQTQTFDSDTRVYGLNTNGDVNGDDTFYVGFKCF